MMIESTFIAQHGPSIICFSSFFAVLSAYSMDHSLRSKRNLLVSAALTVTILVTVLTPLMPTIESFFFLLITGFTAGTCVGLGLSRETDPDPGLSSLDHSFRWTWIVFFGIVALALFLRLIGIEQSRFIIDEHHHIEAAKEYLSAPGFPSEFLHFNDGSGIYDRAWLYTIQVAEMFRVVDSYKLSGRLVSLIWGVLLFVPVIALSRRLRFSRLQTVMVTWWITVSSFLIVVSQWLRMYSMFLTVFLFWVVCLLKLIEARSQSGKLLFGTLVLALMGLSLHLQLLTVTVLPGAGLYWLIASDRFWKTGLTSRLLMAGCFGFFVLVGLYSGWSYVGNSMGFSHLYFTFLVYEPAGWVLGSIFFAVGVIGSSQSRNRLFIVTLIFSSLLLMIFATNRYMAYRYASHLIILSFFTICWGFFRVLNSLGSSKVTQKSMCYLIGFGLPIWELFLWIPDYWQGYMGMLFTHVRILKYL